MTLSTEVDPDKTEQETQTSADKIIKPEELDASKSTVEELEEVILFVNLPKRKVYVGTKLNSR